MNEMIRIENMEMKFKNRILLTEVNLCINKSEIIGFIGPNGCGKSVLFKLISGIYRPDKGDIFIRGKKLGGKDFDFAPDLGILVDSPGFIDIYTGYDNLRYLAGIKNIIDNETIIHFMKLLNLSHTDKTPTKNYSLGMKQKLGIIQAIMENQDIVILDEPFNALDKKSTVQVKELIHSLKKECKTVLLTSHNQQDLDELCDRLYIIDNFKIDIIK